MIGMRDPKPGIPEPEQLLYYKPMNSRFDSEREWIKAKDDLYALYARFQGYPTDDNQRSLIAYFEHFRTAWMNMHAKP
jgi:hypothetical protein